MHRFLQILHILDVDFCILAVSQQIHVSRHQHFPTAIYLRGDVVQQEMICRQISVGIHRHSDILKRNPFRIHQINRHYGTLTRKKQNEIITTMPAISRVLKDDILVVVLQDVGVIVRGQIQNGRACWYAHIWSIQNFRSCVAVAYNICIFDARNLRRATNVIAMVMRVHHRRDWIVSNRRSDDRQRIPHARRSIHKYCATRCHLNNAHVEEVAIYIQAIANLDGVKERCLTKNLLARSAI
mmetsp:Transcript_49118/g.81623  ORF Transcript_49118/g.81623 Transcript_49118/m.81623 type:complete len:240 (-) Transcript_49118:252-971(-)